MSEQIRRCIRQKQGETINNALAGEPNNRGAYLQGLRACRLMAALSQRELARKIGTHQSTICALESQNRGAYPKTIRRLCEALEVEPVDLICGGANEDLK